MERDFKLIDLEDVKKTVIQGKILLFGDNITLNKLNNINNDMDWVRLYDSGEDLPAGFRYAIRKGEIINKILIQKIEEKNKKGGKLTKIPVLIESKEELYINKISDFAKECTYMILGNFLQCVHNFLESYKERFEKGIDNYFEEHKEELHKTLIPARNNLEFLVKGVAKRITKIEPNLTAMALYEETMEDMLQFEYKDESLRGYKDDLNHINEVFINAIILAIRTGLDELGILTLGFAAHLHDIGKIIFPYKIPEAISNGEIPYFPLEKYEDNIEKYIHRFHPLYGAALLSKKNGESIDGLERSVRHIILEHEQFINGTGPSVFHKNYKNLLYKMGISEKTRFHGYNHLPTDSIAHETFPLVNENEYSKRMTRAAQLLNIVEYFVTNRKKIGKQPTIKRMISKAGEWWNCPVLETFLFQVIPEEAIPDVLVGFESSLPKYKGSQVLIRNVNGGKEFYIIKDKEKPEKVEPSELKGKLKLAKY